MHQGSAQSEYSKLESLRHSYLMRARDCSRVTIPTVIPDEGSTTDKRFPTPYQSVGARGVNNLASALLLSLLPPNSPFFRLVVDDAAIRKLQGVDPRIKGEIERAMSERERLVMREIEVQAVRVGVFEALKHLIISGNVGLYFPVDGGHMRVIRMDRYVVKRCPMGKVRRAIIKESVAISMLPEEARMVVAQQHDASTQDVDLYTCIHAIEDGKVEMWQEVKNTIVPGTYGIFDESKSPFIALRMMRVDGEDYGRGYVEQYLGDLKSLEALSQVIVEGAAASSKVLFLVNPNGSTRASTLAKAPNGAIREGSAGDVSVLQVGKQADFATALQTINSISERLSYAFLLTEASIRNAERVTAEEVRLVTQSIERQLGGIYSLLSLEFQLPLVYKIMEQMEREKRLPKVPKKYVTPAIITGIEALGRGNDLNRLDVYLAGIGQVLGPQVIQQYVDVREYLTRRAAALGIETNGLVKSEEQLQSEAQAAAYQNAMSQAMPMVSSVAQQAMMQGMQGQPQQ